MVPTDCEQGIGCDAHGDVWLSALDCEERVDWQRITKGGEKFYHRLLTVIVLLEVISQAGL